MSNETLVRVVDCLATVTRYPSQLLTVEADLENDLGIDSVKRVEIVIALSEQFGVELQAEERDPSIRTIGDIVGWLDRALSRSGVSQGGAENRERPLATATGKSRADTGHASQPQSIPPPHYSVNSNNGSKTASTSREKTLSGQVALVTGSGRGIGRTIARLLAARGATVVVNSFHSRDRGEQTAAEVNAQGGTAVHVWGSVANPQQVDSIFDEVEQRFGHLDILVCNASDGRIGSLLDLTQEDWDRAFRTNVSGHHRCAIRAAQLMRPRGGGSIVTMSAIGAHQFVDGLGSQGVVKAAVETLTRYLACELGQFGIRVNCVVGGPVYGDLLSSFPAGQTTLNHWESIAPDGELCSPMDLAQTIAFLVSNQARGINGAVWTVDHGFSAHTGRQPLGSASRQTTCAPPRRVTV